MRTLSNELGPHAERLSPRPRIYADANVPAGIVAHMRLRLQWDVLFVLEEDDLRRASDAKHYQLAQQLRRTLVTMDRDYLDDLSPLNTGVFSADAPGGGYKQSGLGRERGPDGIREFQEVKHLSIGELR